MCYIQLSRLGMYGTTQLVASQVVFEAPSVIASRLSKKGWEITQLCGVLYCHKNNSMIVLESE